MFKTFQRPDDSELNDAVAKHRTAIDDAKRIIQKNMDGEPVAAGEIDEFTAKVGSLDPNKVVNAAVEEMVEKITAPHCDESEDDFSPTNCEKVPFIMKAKQLLFGWIT